MTLTLRVRRQPASVAVVEVSGELDVAAASALRTTITHALDAGVLDLRVDLSALTFVDAAGLQALARAHAEAVVRGARLEVTRWSWALDRVAVGATTRSLLGGAPTVDA